MVYIFLFTGKTVLNFLFLEFIQVIGYSIGLWRPLYFFFPFIVYRGTNVFTPVISSDYSCSCEFIFVLKNTSGVLYNTSPSFGTVQTVSKLSTF